MNLSSFRVFFKQILQTLGLLLLINFLGLFIDSKFVAENIFKEAQWINNIAVIIVFIYLFLKATARVKEQLIYAILIAIIGEYLFSLIFGMYSYRLGNIPHYIPIGHAIVFIFVYYFSRKPSVKANRKNIEVFNTILILIFSLFFLLFKKDVFGFVCTLFVFFLLRKHPKERLFYLTMYCVIAVIELIGTGFECWKWPEIAFNKFEFLPSGNPPSGICLFYFGLDRGTLSFYKRRHKLTWARLKRIRAIEN